jgi:hypothetical protein
MTKPPGIYLKPLVTGVGSNLDPSGFNLDPSMVFLDFFRKSFLRAAASHGILQTRDCACFAKKIGQIG